MWAFGSVAILFYPMERPVIPTPPHGFFLLTDNTNFLLTDNTPLETAGA